MAKHGELLLLGLCLCASGCVLWQRDPEFYTSELTELLEGRSEAIAACYDRVLEQQEDAAGELAVTFDVAQDTGVLSNFVIVPDQTTVPDPLADCVTTELAQLRLEPPDVNDAHASFRWTFTKGPRKQPPADPFAGVQTAVLGCYGTHLATVDRNASGVLVIDYAFDRKLGTIERLEIVAEKTSAPADVVECAKQALAGAKLDPERLEDRNAAGRRTFTLRFAG
jgi:hypothetical protein